MTNCNNIGIFNIPCIIQNQAFSMPLSVMVGNEQLDFSIYQNIFFDVFNQGSQGMLQYLYQIKIGLLMVYWLNRMTRNGKKQYQNLIGGCRTIRKYL